MKIVGIMSVFSKSQQGATAGKAVKSGIKQAYIQVLGMQSEIYGQSSYSLPSITQEDEERILNMTKERNIFKKLSQSIAPSIFGHDDIKTAIACLLFGGTSKKTSDGMKLRGDINVLLLGDPSTAKSQFLKFVHKAAPICVYTSGKGSSAAGLTASVIKDASTGEFQLEGGAMVLADGGVVCIDEFDKMRADDRVAIHEAMEQQTISIAKAGITTTLNSRTSVLAAANPLHGRYDDLKHAAEQIDFQSAILSRFDTIFIVKDIREDKNDKMIANHVIGLHMNHMGAE
jgi:DNA replication licensing factor MCM5